MLNIPRDTCWDGDKINAANAQGGGPAQAAAVGGLVGVPVSYVVDVNFDKFTALVDGVGGVTVNVPTEMHDTYSGAYFHPGVQHMNGKQALAFSRDRHDPSEGTRHQIGAANRDAFDPRAQPSALQVQANTANWPVPPHQPALPARRPLGLRDHGPLPTRSHRVPNPARPDSFGDDPDRRRRLPRHLGTGARRDSSPTATTVLEKRRDRLRVALIRKLSGDSKGVSKRSVSGARGAPL